MTRKHGSFINGELYHVYNRGVRKSNIFLDTKDYQRWEALLSWCARYDYSYSIYLSRVNSMKLSGGDTASLVSLIKDEHMYKSPLVNIHAYVEMPNHFHLILEQNCENGISKYMQRLLTAYALYFNLKYQLSGSLFESRFQSGYIGSQEQFMQLLLYILRNPLEAGLVKKMNPFYRWSSAPEQIGEKQNSIISTKYIPDNLLNRNDLKNFVLQL